MLASLSKKKRSVVQICALASGSNGNCYYVGNGNEAVIVDCGFSNKQLNERLRKVGLSINKIKAVFISHEHTDHVKGMRVISDKNNIDAYITRKTFNKAKPDYRSAKANFFDAGDIIQIGDIKVHTFAKQHDAVDPVSFRIEIEDKNIAVLTDVGEACEIVKGHLIKCDAAFLESNYEHDILYNGPYPYFLKNRVASNKGHLSNLQAVDLLKDEENRNLKTLILSHISAENNSTDAINEAFKQFSNTHTIEISSRQRPSRLIDLQ